MGMLVNGQWQQAGYQTDRHGGAFVRWSSPYRGKITADGSSGFPAAAGRYHLYVAWACPWAHRTVLFRELKGLTGAIGMTAVNAFMGDDGWFFDEPDPVMGARFLRDVYLRADPAFTGRVTTPVLWDRQRQTIVSNESADIIRMFDRELDAVAEHPERRYAPDGLLPRIDALNAAIYDEVNNGVYKAGFATTQESYDAAVTALFVRLDALEAQLASSRYLLGNWITEADWRLFPTLVRFDSVYHGHFKCNVRRLQDYPNLWGYTRDLYALPRVAATVKIDEIKAHYYRSHPFINPTRIVPKGPVIDWLSPHGRG
jgi:glutathionyl-hydroquinone reductase